MTTRVHPTPKAVALGPILLHGVTYTPVLGTAQDVPDAHAYRLSANGWFVPTLAPNGSTGTTAQRPTAQSNGSPLQPGTLYSDTTISKTIWFDGTTWRDMFSSASV